MIHYKILNIDATSESNAKIQTICSGMNILCSNFTDPMESLEHLMDYKINTLIVHTNIGLKEMSNFLGVIHEDYENKDTPIIIISDNEESDELAFNTHGFNVISILTYKKYHYQLKNLLNILSSQTQNSQTLENELRQSEIRNIIDPLTGALNRYGAIDRFNSLTSRKKAYQESFSLIMLDIDHFKKVNDTYGHDIGDEILISVSSIIKNSIRDTDALIRFGGEEFLIFISKADLNAGIRIAEKFREMIKTKPHTKNNITITASFGVVEYETNIILDDLIKKADKHLYTAKANGRDIVIS